MIRVIAHRYSLFIINFFFFFSINTFEAIGRGVNEATDDIFRRAHFCGEEARGIEREHRDGIMKEYLYQVLLKN